MKIIRIKDQGWIAKSSSPDDEQRIDQAAPCAFNNDQQQNVCQLRELRRMCEFFV